MRRALLILLAVLCLSSCKPSYQSDSRFLFDTVCTITAEGSKDISSAWDALYDLERRISATVDGSEICQIRDSAGKAWVQVSEDTYQMLLLAQELSSLTDGAFDVTVEPVSKLWAFGNESQHKPADSEIEEKLRLVGYKGLLLKSEEGLYWARLEREGMALSLGAIGKGYAADLAARILKELGIESALLDFGGNIYCLGSYDGNPWRIGLQDPSQPRGSYERVVEAVNKSVVTSGVYERSFTENGVLYHHILDARTGWPSSYEYRAVSIIGESSMICDGLSTACFLLGEQKAKNLLAYFEGYEAIFLE